MSLFEKFAKLRELYPEDVERIEAEEERVQKLLEQREFYNLPATRELLALCRKDILDARMKLATERTLPDAAREALWGIIDAREWVLRMLSGDFATELLAIEQQLEADLA